MTLESMSLHSQIAHMRIRTPLLAVLFAFASTVAADAAPAGQAEFETWRAARLERLKKPDGWLSLVGLHWLEQGKHTIGSAKDNGIVLATGPARLGTLDVEGKTVRLTLADGVDATLGDGAERSMELAADVTGNPTVVRFGAANFVVIERSGRLALRVKDANAETRTRFAGMDYFDYAPQWHLEGRFEPHPKGTTIPIATVIDTIEPMDNPGAIVFELDGKTHRVEAVDEGDGQLFVIFGDRTNGKTTYGAGRFVYAAPPAAGTDKVVLDFNQSYNPPCVFTPYATCPLPPPENRLKLAVTAGEKKYAAASH